MMLLFQRKFGKPPTIKEFAQVSRKKREKKNMNMSFPDLFSAPGAENLCMAFLQGKRERTALLTLFLMPINADSPKPKPVLIVLSINNTTAKRLMQKYQGRLVCVF